ncbi:hypothetical protein C7S18_16610 [Ahniella affigens]|uniref:Big-1 domain-containing protein n=1 Tax=Ahniella affigens TaxID=2021234 RepID=A0A2P1PV55_9GAMM|nr:hypothetical protein [Ahniella affigens]AVP98710.1 hypothetical protein C7S18_16610 [Ahniella affigens]
MNYFTRILVAAGVVALSACGGGGSDGGAFTPPVNENLRITISPATSSTTPFSLVDMPIRVQRANGSAVPDGTTVTVQVTPPSVAQVSSLVAVGGDDAIRYGERVTATTAAGVVNFRFHSRAVGSAIVTVSAAETGTSGLSGTNQATVNVVAGRPSDPRLTLTTASTTLPANRFGVEPFLGSPYLADVGITWRRLNGELATTFPPGRSNIVDVTVSPVVNTGGFSVPDDPDTTDIIEFLLHLVTAPVETNGGRAVIFLQSLDQPGTTTVYVSARDPDTDETIQAELPFTITNGTPRLPASITLNRDGAQVYITGSGGTTADRFEAIVTDGGGGFVPDPVSGSSSFNNIQAEIVGGAQGGEKLAASNAAGAAVRDGTIKFRTFSGIAGFSYQAGTRAGLVNIRTTVDRADNNVDNGIQDGVQVTRSLTVGDGRLFDLDITAANIRELRVNPFSEDATPLDPQDPFSPLIPPRPDGTYSYTVSAIATDRFGAPVVPGTEIRFGLIDAPQINGSFAIFGSDGNPGEGTTNFTAPTGAFQTQGGGAGPGDTVVVFGEDSIGNRDLESARTVSAVNSQTSLTTTYRFNFNDDTGVSVNNGPVLPYLIGRATDGNFSSVVPVEGPPQASFGAAAFTDFNGVARVTLNYGVVKIGKLSAIYAQGVGDVVNNSSELVTDVELVRYPGLAPGSLTVNPSDIAGNRTVSVTACLRDRLGSGAQGILLNYRFANLGAGTGRVNGVTGPGALTTPTGQDGCVTVDVSTSGVVQTTGTTPSVIFETPALSGATGILSDSANILVGLMFLTATPETITGDGGRLIDLQLVDAGGLPVPGVLIVGNCTATGGATLTITTQAPITNAQGRTQAVASGQGFDVTSGSGSATGTCTFTVAGGTVSDTVTWGSQNICDLFSPAVPEGCPAATLLMNITGSGVAGSVPAGLNCTGPGSCSREFAPTSSVQLVLSAAPTVFTCQTSGGPLVNFAPAATASIVMPPAGQTITCNVTFP